MNKKSLVTKISAVAFIALMVLPIAVASADVQATAWTDPAEWYNTVEGVLASDYYSLYPYREESLKVGYSKFGELIDSNTNVGLEYAGERDPFAAPAGPDIDPWGKLPKKVWINGWYIDLRYNHSSWGYRNVWAGALFADLTTYGGPWIRVDNDYWGAAYPETWEWEEDFRDPGLELDANGDVVGTDLVYGGRKTNGTVITDDPVILYDGPRRFVVQLRNRIYDYNEIADEKLHLVNLTFTIIFNKVKKEVIVLKDVKYIPQAKYQIAPIRLEVEDGWVDVPFAIVVQFSNRDEWDLGTDEIEPKYASYVHFYTEGMDGVVDTVPEGLQTVYGEDWTMIPTLPAGYSIVGDGTNLAAHGNEPGTPVDSYDVAQVISNDLGYVGWAAYWPSLSDWSADAGSGRRNLWWRSMSAADPHDIDSFTSPNDEPFLAPLTVGEWDFLLSESPETIGPFKADRQFRGVTVYGVTDLNTGTDGVVGNEVDGVDPWQGIPYGDGDDADRTLRVGDNIIDREVYYQLQEVFNPWDLVKAVHKDTKRWVEWDYDSTGTFTTSRGPVVENIWDAYSVFTERVIDLTTGELLKRDVDYTITWNADGTATISGLTPGDDYKILYSTNATISERVIVWVDTDYELANFNTVSNRTDLSAIEFNPSWTDNLGVEHEFYAYLEPITIHLKNDASNWSDSWSWSWTWEEEDFKVFKEETTYLSDIDDLFEPVNYTGPNFDVENFDWGDIWKSVTSTELDTVHVYDLDHTLQVTIDAEYNEETDYLNLTITVEVTADYEESIGGRYEWTVVGRDAASVDSIGSALVTAAFKNKQREIGTAGVDMDDPELANSIPWIMSKFGTGDDWADYLDNGSTPGDRAALKDDWCTYWPISSSNIIGVGGPLANLVSYYGNDFTEAFYGIPDFTPYGPWSGAVSALTCWNKNGYYSSADTGYAVIATYKDINGTVIFLVWGVWGRDTFYATQWLYGDEARGILPGIHQLQDAPGGITSIILEINYDDPEHPTFSIVEVLGTISEREWIHGEEEKGGIHDP